MDPRDELREALHTFSRRGLSDNICVSVSELRFALTNLGDKMTDDEVSNFFQKLDQDEYGNVTHEDIVAAIFNN